ncbi:hypothetical protein HDU76_000248 [Blyttiomyces sp. JEL0837]|nr:hypothetical protein HDU76_000248 [Blyttiomyces sp. JEL0837]
MLHQHIQKRCFIGTSGPKRFLSTSKTAPSALSSAPKQISPKHQQDFPWRLAHPDINKPPPFNFLRLAHPDINKPPPFNFLRQATRTIAETVVSGLIGGNYFRTEFLTGSGLALRALCKELSILTSPPPTTASRSESMEGEASGTDNTQVTTTSSSSKETDDRFDRLRKMVTPELFIALKKMIKATQSRKDSFDIKMDVQDASILEMDVVMDVEGEGVQKRGPLSSKLSDRMKNRRRPASLDSDSDEDGPHLILSVEVDVDARLTVVSNWRNMKGETVVSSNSCRRSVLVKFESAKIPQGRFAEEGFSLDELRWRIADVDRVLKEEEEGDD